MIEHAGDDRHHLGSFMEAWGKSSKTPSIGITTVTSSKVCFVQFVVDEYAHLAFPKKANQQQRRGQGVRPERNLRSGDRLLALR